MKLKSITAAIGGNSDAIAERFWSKVDKRGPDECWPWLGMKTDKGYGRFSIGSSLYVSTRVAFTLANKRDPGNLFVCHACDNPGCCNPAHLWLGTNKDNCEDRCRKGRHCKLTREQVETIMSSPMTCTELGKEFGVARETVSGIRRGLGWTWLTRELAA